MTTWFVSRHPGALDWMKQAEIAFDIHAPHLDTQLIEKGDKVIGSLPVNLAAEVCAKGAEYWNLSLNLPEAFRGIELSAQQLKRCAATIERFEVRRVE